MRVQTILTTPRARAVKGIGHVRNNRKETNQDICEKWQLKLYENIFVPQILTILRSFKRNNLNFKVCTIAGEYY